jgi:hypothetical protein
MLTVSVFRQKKKKSPLGISADGSIAHSFIFRDVLSYRLSSGSSQLSILTELKVPEITFIVFTSSYLKTKLRNSQ